MFNFSINERTIDINEIDELIGEINLIDIRAPHEFKCGTLRTAKNIPMDTLLNNPDKYLDKDKKYYIMCRAGRRSAITCRELKYKGFDVVDVTSGMAFYEGNERA